MNYGEKLKKRREELGITQEEVCRKLQISRNTLRKYEQGKEEIPISLFLVMTELYDIDCIDICGVRDSNDGLLHDISMYLPIKNHIKREVEKEMELLRRFDNEFDEDYYSQYFYKRLKEFIESNELLCAAAPSILKDWEKDNTL